ncbi:MAG: glycosyltransferase [Humibacillus sp.]|nr:glycosyltransferase [Humibacillus sp.]MDN5775710.1 glycosyltransferase [Humibacillus sp.]
MSSTLSQRRSRPFLSVVVPSFEGAEQLDRLLAALELQTMGHDHFEVVIADDGSPQPPEPGGRPFRVRVVGQADLGFRAAAARNLGAQAAAGDVIVFLDQDCVPSPRYLERVTQHTNDGWNLTVGRRRHVDLKGWNGIRTASWLAGDGPAPRDLTDPPWLVDGYARTDNLRRPDARAYQLVISAALTVSRDLHEHLSGFDESFTTYGGEDWDYGHRAIVAGAELCHLPEAVVWHDGPDLADRDQLVSTKNAETLALARRLPDRDVRGEHLFWSQPDIVVRLDAQHAEPATVVASIESLLAGSDAHVWLGGGAEGDPLSIEDPRVHVGAPSAAILGRARYVVDCAPVLLAGTTLRHLCLEAPVRTEHLALRTTRSLHREGRGLSFPPWRAWPAGAQVTRLRRAPLLERYWQTRP